MKLISELYVYPVYDRVSYEKAFGHQAPPFNPTQAPKRWLATDGATSFLVPDLRGGTATITVNAATVAAINLTGHYRPDPVAPNPPYPGYASPDDATQLANMLGGKVAVNGGVGMAAGQTWLEIQAGGYSIPAAILVLNWYKLGKSNPGTWTLQDGNLAFHPAPAPIEQPIAGVTPAELPIPIRPLQPGEKIVFPVMGQPVVQDDQASPAGGSFNDQDRAILYQIAAKVLGG